MQVFPRSLPPLWNQSWKVNNRGLQPLGSRVVQVKNGNPPFLKLLDVSVSTASSLLTISGSVIIGLLTAVGCGVCVGRASCQHPSHYIIERSRSKREVHPVSSDTDDEE